MAAGNLDIRIDQGSVFALSLEYTDAAGVAVNLTGFTARMQVRKSATAPAPVLNLTSGSGITLGGAAGTIALYASDSTTAGVPAGDYVYSLELDPGGGNSFRLLEGKCTVTAEVTRA